MAYQAEKDVRWLAVAEVGLYEEGGGFRIKIGHGRPKGSADSNGDRNGVRSARSVCGILAVYVAGR